MPIIRRGKTNRANNAHYDYGLQWSEVDEFYSPGEATRDAPRIPRIIATFYQAMEILVAS